MPITCPVPVRPISQEEFADIDYRVMRCAFDSQNELGRLCDEVIYRNDLAARLESAGLRPVYTELPVTITHRDFAKTYRMDLVVGDAAVYELKTDTRLVSEHESQLLNYLFLFGAQHGKLVNFRPAQVDSRFVNSVVTREARRRFEVDERQWRDVDDGSRNLRSHMLEILADWGGFLELPLYVEALTHFAGGERTVVKMVPLVRGGMPLGMQRFHLASPGTAFRQTALAEGAENYAPQLQAMLRHSPLRTLQWINLARHRVEFRTLTR